MGTELKDAPNDLLSAQGYICMNQINWLWLMYVPW